MGIVLKNNKIRFVNVTTGKIEKDEEKKVDINPRYDMVADSDRFNNLKDKEADLNGEPGFLKIAIDK